jgi:spore germination protein YaaH
MAPRRVSQIGRRPRGLAVLLAVALVAGCGTAPSSGGPVGVAGGSAPSVTQAPATPGQPGVSGPPAPPATMSPTPAAPTPARPGSTGSPPPSAAPAGSDPSLPVTPPAAPAGPWDPLKFGFAAKGMAAEVMAFVPRGQLPYALETMDWDVVSTVAYFSLEATREGRIARDGGWKGWNGARMDRLIRKAHANGTKVVLSLERFAWSSGQRAITRHLLASPERRLRLAREVAREVVRRGVDGVNVDFEPIPAGQAAEFTDLVKLLRRELDRLAPGSQLTFCVVGHHGSWDVEAATGPDGADAVFLMGYHYAGTWSKRAGSTAPMGGPQHDVVDTVKSLLRQVEPHELIVGLPYYGHAWPTADASLNAPTTGAGFDVTLDRAMKLAAANELRYDKRQQVAWLPYRARPCPGCPSSWYQLYFDDPRATEHKLRWIRKRELLGTGVWTIGFEGGLGPHAAVMRKLLLDG